MSELNAAHKPVLESQFAENAAALAESFNRCFDLKLQFGAVTTADWGTEPGAAPSGPGVVCLIQVGSVAAAMLISETLSLPEWFCQPDDSQQERLNTLAREWGVNLLPPELEADRTGGFAVEDLAEFIGGCSPADDAAVIRLTVVDADLSEVGQLQFLWPLISPTWLTAEPEPPQVEPKPAVKPASDHNVAPQEAAPKPNSPPRPDPFVRLRKLPVTISVRLTERRINVSQLLAITPGALLTFNKSCDELLDLYVNNALYCRGEAVKINECFGLKINEIGGPPPRPSKVLDG